jgi:hypothetical protein
MKLNLFELGEKNDELIQQLPVYFDFWQKQINEAEPVFDIKGAKLENLARDLPQHQFHYAKFAQEAKALVKWLEIQKARAESKYVKNYNNSSRALGVKEQSQYLQGEKEVYEMNQLIVEANLKQQQLDEIVEAVKQLGWMIGAMVKLRVAELQEVVI